MRPTAKRKLKDINFETEGAHVALVSKAQDGPANGHDYAVILKANNFSDEYIQKIQQVQVTLEFPEFLERFFGMWETDAEVLAALLGYVEPVDETDDATPEDTWEQYLIDQIQSFTIFKAANEAATPELVLSNLSQEQFLQMRQDQAMIEKAMSTKPRTKVKPKAKDKAGKKMLDPTTEQTLPDAPAAGVGVAKAAADVSAVDTAKELESIQKAFEDTRILLEKATAEIAAFKAEKLEALIKAKSDKVLDVVKDGTHAEILVKAALALDDTDFDKYVSALTAVYKQVETSSLFKEEGISTGETEIQKMSGVAAILKAQYKK